MRTELYINGTRVDLYEEVGVSLNLAISDIKNPDKRVSAFSRTVKIAGSSVVNRLFSHIFDFTEIQNTTTTNFTPDYNPNLKATAIVLCDGAEQFRGYVRMRNIIREGSDLSKITYEIELFGELGNIVTNLGSALMSELDLSEYNHTYDRSTQKATWTTIHPSGGYYYPMIQYGDNDGVNWNVNHFYPAVYEKVYLDKILEYAGYTYESPFLEGSIYSKFVVPHTGESFLLSQDQANNRLFDSKISAPYTILDTTTWGTIPVPFIFDAEITDIDNQYDPLTGVFTCVSAGYYEFKVSGDFNWSAVGGSWSGASSNWLTVVIYHRRGSTTMAIAQQNVYNNNSSLASGNTSATKSFTVTSPTTQINAGDELWVWFYPQFNGFSPVGWQYAQFNLVNAKFFNSVNNASIVEGGTVDMNAAIPRDIKMVDFLMSVIKDFNLMLEPDKNLPNKVYIDTAADFYGSGTIRDWSKKMDVSKPVMLAPMGALDARRYILQWTPAEDWINKEYTSEFQEGYGMKKYDVANDFLKNDNVYTSIFSPSPLVGSNNDDRVYPHIYVKDASGNRRRVKSGIRRLYAGGAISTGQSWNYITASGTFTETDYPYAGHLDSISTPTLDVNFTNPRRVYYTPTNYTDGNLWNLYHKKYIDEITDKNSKILTAYFYLTPFDIARLSFRDPIFIDNQYYRLQKIVDYNPATVSTTKCELLLIKTREAFVSTTYPWLSYQDNTNGNVDSTPRGDGGDSGGVNVFSGEGIFIESGTVGNAVFGSRNVVGGDRNFVAASSGVQIYPDIYGAVVINSDNVTVTRNNETWINGTKYTFGSSNVYNITSNYTITEAGTYYCDGLLTLSLESTVLAVNDRIQIFNLGSSTVTVAGNGLNIVYANNNSVASFNLNHKYESLTLTYAGTYYIVT